ncbi:S9 family peptidase [Actinokineospora bangkokensis]|uniref:Dipeptidyl aminopeptidase n=1 Tax=Actinokineospora bangkokensis TaxID=1193682 RepID=A0A1Q9LRT8_9PSEU|nr:S9 family peptidase [Actinokineospora bangkokensis]OLR94767.1 dipeptidyl aminopeptidase [Actinokineospora bangkokensis]
MRAEDIELLATPGTPALRGDFLVAAVTAPDLADNSYRGGLHRVPLDGGPVRPFTRGYRDSAPVLSPDGTTLAFLRAAGPGSPAQLHVMPVDGGEPSRLTDLPLGAGAPVWSPDSTRLAFTARVPEDGRYGTDPERPDPGDEAPRRITRLDYRIDDVGFLLDRPRQLFTVGLDGGEPVRLTDGLAEPSGPAWAPSGEHVVVAAKAGWGERDTQRHDLYAVPVEPGAPVLVARSAGSVESGLTVAEDMVVYLGDAYPGDNTVATNVGLWAVPLRLDGTPAEPRRLTDEETVDCEGQAPVVTPGGVLVCVRNRGAVELRRVPVTADAAELSELALVAGEQAVVRGFAADGDRVVCTVSSWDTAGELVLVTGDESCALTDFGAELRGRGVRPLVEIKASAPDGYATHGWLVLPEGEGPHPVLLVVHGGPFMYYSWGLFDEAQVYADAGYAVVLPNPRGSAGYGQAHGRSILGALGTVDAVDVLAVLDAALERPDLDADRVGVMGGSYGGWMTGWLAAHHGERFTAAWSERAVNAWDSFVGSSDIGWWFAGAYCGDDREALLAQSPLTHVDKIGIPFAVVHSEHDWRCPLEQAQRMFVALKRNGVETELLVFPGEGHELTRSGSPRHRTQRFAAVLDWWSRHL